MLSPMVTIMPGCALIMKTIIKLYNKGCVYLVSHWLIYLAGYPVFNRLSYTSMNGIFWPYFCKEKIQAP